jgi:hypothetical protein
VPLVNPDSVGAGDALTSVATCNLHFQHWCTAFKFLESGFLNTLEIKFGLLVLSCVFTLNGLLCVLFPKFLREKIRDQVYM